MLWQKTWFQLMGFALATACRSLGSQGFCALAIIRGWVLVAFVCAMNLRLNRHSSFGKRFVEALTPLFLQSRDSRCVNLWRCFWKLLHPPYRFHPGSIVVVGSCWFCPLMDYLRVDAGWKTISVGQLSGCHPIWVQIRTRCSPLDLWGSCFELGQPGNV